MIVLGRFAWLLPSLLVMACLPLGEPPSGRQLLAARDLENVGFIQPAPGQRASIVTFRYTPVYDQTVCASFWSVIAVDDTSAAGGLATERLLAGDVERPGPIDEYAYYSPMAPYAVPTDVRGRLFVAWQPKTPAVPVESYFVCPAGRIKLARLDPTTGERTELGSLPALGAFGGDLSSDRTTVAFTQVDPAAVEQPQVVVRDGDDREIAFAGTTPTFVGNDLYAIGADRALVKLAPGGAPLALVADVSAFVAVKTARGPLLNLLTESGQSFESSLFDPVTETVTMLPATPNAGRALPLLSPSGRFVMQTSTDYATRETTLDLFDRDTGATERRNLTNVNTSYWRLDKDEFWVESGDDGGQLTRWTPGTPSVTIDVSPGFGSFLEGVRFWLRTSRAGTRTEARDPDDPGAPGYVLTPPGASLTNVPRTLADGRLLVEANVATGNRYDIFVVDPVARTSRPIASGGTILAVGRTRVLALLKVTSGNSGELSLVDLETGATTLIAENAYRYAVEPPAAGASSDDPLAPGLRVLALVRSRIASPYDGLWLSTLP